MTDHITARAYAVLAALADGQFHSGRTIGERFQISRTAVWQAVQVLNQFGLDVSCLPGKGYRLQRPLELLEYHRIRSFLSATAKQHITNWYLFPCVASTSGFLKHKSQSNNCHGHLCVAEMQTQGRGRRGRSWVSPFGCNLYFSLVWHFEKGLDSIIGLSLAVAVLVLEVLQKFSGKALKLKWPNDIVCDGGKLAGILVEASGESSGDCQTIIGIGINVSMSKQTQIDQAWTGLSQLMGETPSRNELFAYILNVLIEGLGRFSRYGLAPFLEKWRQFDMFAGQSVEVQIGQDKLYGMAEGIDEYGALWVRTALGRKRFHQADVSLRLQPV